MEVVKQQKAVQQQRYYYVIALEKQWCTRKLVNELSFARGVFEELVSVTDLQNDSHIYGATYEVYRSDEEYDAAHQPQSDRSSVV